MANKHTVSNHRLSESCESSCQHSPCPDTRAHYKQMSCRQRWGCLGVDFNICKNISLLQRGVCGGVGMRELAGLASMINRNEPFVVDTKNKPTSLLQPFVIRIKPSCKSSRTHFTCAIRSLRKSSSTYGLTIGASNCWLRVRMRSWLPSRERRSAAGNASDKFGQSFEPVGSATGPVP